MINKNTPNLMKFNVADTFPIEREVSRGSNTQISFAGGTDGTATAGTITITVKSPGSTNFETPAVPIVIDISAPTTFTVVGNELGSINVDLTGFAGTATQIELAMSYFN